MGWFNELQRVSVWPENAARLSDAFGDIDVSGLLGTPRAPTLVLHARGDLVCPFSEGRCLAAAIPGAQLVALESANHILLDGEPAFERLLAEVEGFVQGLDRAGAEGAPAQAPRPPAPAD